MRIAHVYAQAHTLDRDGFFVFPLVLFISVNVFLLLKFTTGRPLLQQHQQQKAKHNKGIHVNVLILVLE